MLELIIAALLSLGIITNSEQATQDVIDAHQTEVDDYIINVDTDEVF